MVLGFFEMTLRIEQLLGIVFMMHKRDQTHSHDIPERQAALIFSYILQDKERILPYNDPQSKSCKPSSLDIYDSVRHFSLQSYIPS